MTPLQIQKPIWKTRSVGIAEHKIGQSGIDIEIIYKDTQGNRLYPHVYTITRERLLKCPTQVVMNNVRLRIVPINDLEVKEYR
jgi:hypothetical protein